METAVTISLILCGRLHHGRSSMGGQGDMSPLLFEVEGMPCVLSPLLFWE